MKLSLLWIPIPLVVGFLSGQIGKPDKWYENLKKPYLNPPKILFPIVWSFLYLLIGYAYYLLSKQITNISFWYIPIFHLLLNFSYSPVFFYFKELLLAAVITILILVFALLTMYQFWKKNKISVYLMIPYIIWLCFANYLSWSIYFLNSKNLIF